MNWRDTTIHFGKNAGIRLRELPRQRLLWWVYNWFPNDDFCKLQRNHGSTKDREAGARLGCKDCILRLALDQVYDEIFQSKGKMTP